MSNAGAADEWDVVVPEDAEELLAELWCHGVRPGERVHVRAASARLRAAKAASGAFGATHGAQGRRRSDDGEKSDADPEFFGSVRSGRRDLAERSKAILKAEFPG